MTASTTRREALIVDVFAHPWVRWSIRLPVLAAVAYVLLAGRVVSWELFVALVVAGLALTVGVARGVRDRLGDPRWERVLHGWQVFSAVVGVAMLAPFLVAAVEVPVELFSVVFALVLVVGAYTLAERVRVALSAWMIVVWLVTLWWAGVHEPVQLTLHAGGAVLAVLASTRVADALVDTARRVGEARERAERRARLLASVLRTQSLDPSAVMRAVVDGLGDVGFDVAVIRTVDPINRTAPLVADRCTVPLELPDEIPVDLGLFGVTVRERRELVVDSLDRDPRAVDHGYGLRGTYFAPLMDGQEVVAVVAGASRSGPLTDEQVDAARQLSTVAEHAFVRARAYDADRRTVEELRRLDERTQDFVSTVSHELRTPLTVIQGIGRTLADRWDDLDAGRRTDLLQRIGANAERLAVMVRSLLDTDALERGELDLDAREVALEPLVAALLDRLATVTAAHPVVLDVPEGLRVLVDPALFEHVLENLLTNVAKHTPQGTLVTISAVVDDGRARIEVADDGPGIDPEDLPHVLDRFYRGGEPRRQQVRGLGLGLALARQVVQAHGGDLEVDSDPGRGTRFRFSVPAPR